jgi:hypothetical protein
MDLPSILIIIGASAVVGFLTANLIASLRGGLDAPDERSDSTARLDEILWLMRDRKSGKLVVRKDRRTLHTKQELNHAQWMELAAVAREFNSWLELPSMDGQSEFVPPQTPGHSMEADSISQPEETVVKPSMNPLDALRRSMTATSDRKPVSLSLTAQIDEILQEMLATSPLAGRGIRLQESVDQGVIVCVGMEQYDGIDAVPDDHVREILRSAVKEWQRRMQLSR